MSVFDTINLSYLRRLENEIQLFCRCFIKKLHHLKEINPPVPHPTMSPACHQVGVPPPPLFYGIIFHSP